ncbi:MAG: PilW family protein [Candidatus Methylomirabilales bacterium]
MAKMTRKIQRQRGFTLLEMLISSAIFAIVLLAIYTMHITNQDTSTRGVNKIESQQNARVAKERMAREIRMAGYDPSDAIAAQSSQVPVQLASANTLTFIADIDDNGVSDRVTYRLQGTQVIRETASWVGGAWTPNPPASSEMADNVTALSFTYYDGNDNVTATLTDIRRITMLITTQETAGGMIQTFPLRMDVRLRNA